VPREETFSADLTRTRVKKGEGRFEEALGIVEGVLNAAPDLPDALFLKGEILWEGFGRKGEALICFKKVLQSVDEKETLHRWASEAYHRIKKTIT
jgi:hypothetical protein